ncbi:MAG: isoleucine--tRNA ligase [Thermogutta sp.]
MFNPVDRNLTFPKLEERICAFWKAEDIYRRCLDLRRDGPRFVFYEGPPTANGLPHPGHCLTRAIKDLFPRYKTMRGYFCERRAGWDTHGLPVEVEVCKELGIHSKQEIEQFGVEPFIRRCLESVFRYTKEWEQLTERIGFWIRLDDAYVTYHQSYVESVWWALKELFQRGLLYQGYKIVWWWAQGGTALSSGEVGQGYREVADPSVYVRFPLLDEPGVDLVVWTTTPWTLPSNQFAAVRPDLTYRRVRFEGDKRDCIAAAALIDVLAQKLGKSYQVVGEFAGEALVGKRYRPPFDYYWKEQGEKQGRLKDGGREYLAWRVVAADFVTIDTGTGIVHQAPAFGEVDYEVLLREQARFLPGEGPELICAVAPDGTFTADAPDYEGRWVKDCDRDIIRRMRGNGVLLHFEQYVHDYPFCWRAEEDPLIQYPRKSWFIRTTAFRDAMLANNRRIGWLPENIRDGRFGNFLESNVDWALSRERFWGTPLPIWVCERTGKMEAVGSYAELLAKPGVQGTEVWEQAKQAAPDLSEHLKVHKPYIDAVTYASPFAPGARMRRVPEVIDCWFDSGAMPFAQWGFPHRRDSAARLAENFPADFISEAIDQTRGWFYSLLAISTLLFGPREGEQAGGADGFAAEVTPKIEYPHPFRNCVVLGLMLGEDGQKMSKSKRNYREPQEIFDRYGADALRWYFFANQAPWTSIRYNEQAIRESVPEFLLRLWNVYSFFVIYANIDGWDPTKGLDGAVGDLKPNVLARAEGYRPPRERGELDRWILSELHHTAAQVQRAMDAYDNLSAAQAIQSFVDALANWYVRRSRSRFWSGTWDVAKTDAYWTLYECLVTTVKMTAPFVPFISEEIWRNLVVTPFGERAKMSVHLCDYPEPEPDYLDPVLCERMSAVREFVSLGRSARAAAKLKVRQPLSRVEIIPVNRAHEAWLKEHADLICEELNVKSVDWPAKADEYVVFTVLPDFKRLGPRLGRRLPALKAWLAAADGAAVQRALEETGRLTVDLPDGSVVLTPEDVQVRLAARPGWTAAHGPRGVVVLATELTPDLIAEGLIRDLVHVIQNRRKELDLDFTDRIRIGIQTDSEELSTAVRNFEDYIKGETLAVQVAAGPIPDAEGVPLKLGDAEVELFVLRADD